ncbi:MAG TPA: hypothetical protein HA326_01940 [Thermoplasmata archaeon]|nr:hypothetical protein [Thermoplasmata archaeon]
MRGVQWDPQRGLRCADCGGYEVELLDGGLARCRSCGRTSVPTRTRRLAGTGRVMFTILGLFFILLGVEVAAV